jgi:ubiquinone/menaquinone biosynthesis C-methylase UbiE
MTERDVRTYWEAEAERYAATAYRYQEQQDTVRYPFYEIRKQRVLELLEPLARGRLLDAGCGGGEILAATLAQGWDGFGFDFADNMVKLARGRLQRDGHDPGRIERASLAERLPYEDGRFDAIVCIGVLEYIDPATEVNAFAELRRVLEDRGTLIVENVNQLFDLGTFNRFTVEFFRQHFVPRFVPDPAAVDRVVGSLRRLLTFPDKPDRSGAYSTTRDQVYVKSEIPIAYAEKVSRFGFREVDRVFYRLHALPPLLFEEHPEWERLAIPFEREYCRHWVGNFLASGFLSVLRKT